MTCSTRDRPTKRLRAAVKSAYNIFAPYKPGPQLATCRCPMCMDDWTERKLLTTKPKHIDLRLLCEYTWSANGSNERKFSADELRHFLPRYFHFMAYGLWPNFGDEPAPTLRQLGHFSYRTKWPAHEIVIIDEFFSALFERALAQPLAWGPNAIGEEISWSEIEDPLCAIAYAGGDVNTLLKDWERQPGLLPLLHIAWTIVHTNERMSDGKRELWNPFWRSGEDAVADLVLEWLFRPETVSRLYCALKTQLSKCDEDLLTNALQRLADR